jgi:hypothetical protein
MASLTGRRHAKKWTKRKQAGWPARGEVGMTSMTACICRNASGAHFNDSAFGN